MNTAAFLRENGAWLFGSGGAAALALALLRLFVAHSQPKPSASNHVELGTGADLRGDVVGGHKTTVHQKGLRVLDVAIVLALLVLAVGGLMVFIDPGQSIEAQDGSAGVQGSNNTTTVIHGQ